VFVLLSMMDFSYPETVAVACLAIAVQSLVGTKTRPRPIQLLFNLASAAIAVAIGYTIYHRTEGKGHILLTVAIAATGYFLSNIISIAAVVALTESKSLRKVWHECYFWSFPYCLIGGLLQSRSVTAIAGSDGKLRFRRCPWSLSFSALIGFTWGGWNRRSATPNKSRPCTGGPLKHSRWPSRLKTG
jgi:branched-subunit amino acid ABC-type transport system permease component